MIRTIRRRLRAPLPRGRMGRTSGPTMPPPRVQTDLRPRRPARRAGARGADRPVRRRHRLRRRPARPPDRRAAPLRSARPHPGRRHRRPRRGVLRTPQLAARQPALQRGRTRATGLPPARALPPARRNDLSMLVDVFPTVVDLVDGSPGGQGLDGRALFARARRARRRRLSPSIGRSRAAPTSRGWSGRALKLQETRDEARGQERSELYDLARTPRNSGIYWKIPAR